jgi:hypothetical protein
VCGSPEETAAEPASAGGKTSRLDVTLALKAKPNLSDALFDGAVAAVTDAVQAFDSPKSQGHWQWQIRPNSPGDFVLPLGLMNYDNAGEHQTGVADIVNVNIHVPMTTGYATSTSWLAFASFLNSLQGIVASVAGAAAGSAGFRAWVVRKSKKAAKVVAAAAPATSSNGYL